MPVSPVRVRIRSRQADGTRETMEEMIVKQMGF